MPIVLGLLVGFFVWAHLFVFIAPLLAVLNFFTGRFFVAAVMMVIAFWCGTLVWDDFHVDREVYEALLILGLSLEVLKWLAKLWWNRVRVSDEPELIINLIDDEDPEPVMRDVTPRARQIR